jgi:hypothetical protein
MYGRSSVTTASYPRWSLSIEILSKVNLRPRVYHLQPPAPSYPISWTIDSFLR